MSTPQNIDHIDSAGFPERALAIPRSFESLASRQSSPQPVVRSPDQLHLHRALDEVGWNGVIGDLSDAIRAKDAPAEPVLITASGIILAGLGYWRLALLERRQEIQCIEYSLTEDESLQFILTYHQARRGWNAFVRIRLALVQRPLLRQKALDKMRVGGRYKGWATLPKAKCIEVRREIARAAGVGARNVSKVERILEVAHDRLLGALREGTLTINRAFELCRLPRKEQLEQFVSYSTERATNEVIRRSIKRSRQTRVDHNAITVLDALQRIETQRPGSVEVRIGQYKRTVLLVNQDQLKKQMSQSEVKGI